MSIALARKYRPRNFASVAVQSHVANTLKGAIANDRVAAAYLLCGPRGTGKTTLARVLAMALNCETLAAHKHDPVLAAADDGEPCGVCTSCQRIWAGSASLDVVEIDAASNRGVDDARELRERAMYAPSGEDRYKVYIVDEAHMLTREAWNALLKVLEEPPPRVVFVFATTDPQKIAQAAAPVLSRLQRFELKRIGPAEIRDRLAVVLREEQVTFDDESLSMIARAADGGLRDALSLADQVLSLGDGKAVTAVDVRAALGLIADDEFLALLDIVAERRAADVFPAVQTLADAGVDFTLVLSGLGDLLRAQLAMELGGDAGDLPERLRVELAQRRGRASSADLLRMLHALLEIEPAFRRSGQPQLLLETLLVRFALLDRTIDLEEVLGGFQGAGSADPPVRRSVASETSPGATARPAERSRPAVKAAVPATPGGAAAAAPRSPKPAAADGVPELAAVRAAWPRAIEAVRKAGRGMVAESMQRMTVAEVDPAGRVVLVYAALDDMSARGVEAGRADVIAALASDVDGVTGLLIRLEQATGPSPKAAVPAGKRLTQHEVSRQRTEQLTTQAPLLDAAVKALDLELID